MTTLNMSTEKRRRRKRRIIVTLFAAGYILGSVWGIHVLDQILQTKSADGLNYSYWMAVQNLVISERHKVLFLAAQLLLLFLVLQTYKPRASIQVIETRKITEDIEIPVPAGNGQYGSERFLNEEEKNKIFQKFDFRGSEDRLEQKGGVVVQMTKKGSAEQVLFVGRDLHTLIIGASGSGKTRRILFETIWLQIMSGLSIVASDVKGELFYFTCPFAQSHGYDCIAVDFRNPLKSAHYNFLQPILNALEKKEEAKAVDYTWDLVSVLVGEQKGEPLWYNGETASIAASILAVALEAPEECRNLTNVYYFLAYMCQADESGDMPLNRYLESLPDTHPAKTVFAMARIAAGRTRSSFFTSALGTLKLFTNPHVAEMTSQSDFDLKDIGRKKTIVYMMIPDDKKTLYPLVSILLTQMYSLQVELANEHGLRLPVDTDYDLDEVGNFPRIPVLGAIASAGRSRGVRLNLLIQDFQQLEAKYKDDFKNIRTNCQVKIYLKSDDNDTLKWISENLGKYTVELASASSSVSTDDRNKGMNFSSSSNLGGRALLEPAEIKRIKAPYAIVMAAGDYAGINYLPDLSEYRLNRLYGMGDSEKENAGIMMQREEGRVERKIGVDAAALWGIWNQYRAEITPEETEGERISFL